MLEGLYGILVIPLFQVHISKDLPRMSVTMFTMPLHSIYLDVVPFRFFICRDDQAMKTRYCLFTFATHEHEDRLSGRKLNRDVYDKVRGAP